MVVNFLEYPLFSELTACLMQRNIHA
jgi:hypothetical protein